MYYEVYLDSLFLINFVLNLYLLLLTNRSLLCPATRGRLILAAAAGGGLYLMPFCWDVWFWLKLAVGMTAGMAAMLAIAFRPGTLRAFGKVAEWFLLYSFLLGGFLLFFMGCAAFLQQSLSGVLRVLGVGTLGFWVLSRWQKRRKNQRRHSFCRATLIRGEHRSTVSALIDSGNSLVEPISGKPVSVIDRELYRELWGAEEALYRVVPYHSIGRKNGILKCFLLPHISLEMDGIRKEYRDVYVAVSEEANGEVRMILNPQML